MSVIILLVALVLALAAGYFFLQWKCPSKKDKLQSLTESAELEEKIDFSDSENITSAEIKEKKKELEEGIKKIKALQKKKENELTEEESKALANLPVLQEIQTLTRDVQKTKDFGKRVYGTWDMFMPEEFP
jgi:uncharacterized protein HemX